MSQLTKKVVYLCTGVGLVAVTLLTIGILSTQNNNQTAFTPDEEIIEVFYPVESLGDELNGTEEVDLDATVGIKDLILQQSINRTFERPSDTPITVAEMQSLKSLVCTNCGISDLSGLEYATNLEMLELHGNYISDLSPLSELSSLKSVCLGKNRISDLSAIGNLTNLETLEVSYNQVEDLSPVSALANLKSMSVMSNQISDLSPLANLDSLQTLNLQGNEVADVAPLSDMEGLQKVNLDQNPVEDLTPVFSVFNLPEAK